ncbi:MAG: ATP-binding protein, partial [Sediminispirochaetaceae bacterium]
EFNSDGVQGFAVDMLERIAEEAGWALEWKRVTFPVSMELLAEGKVDLIVPLGYTAERDERFDFSEEALLTTWGRVFTKEKSDIFSLLDLKEKRVGYVRNSLFYPVMYNLILQFGIECEFISVPSYDILFSAISRGELDAGLADRLQAYSIPGNLKISTNQMVFHPFDLHVAGAEGDPGGYLAAVDRTISELKKNTGSFYYRSQNKWFGQLDSGGLPRWVSIAGILVLVGGILIGLWTLSLRRQVAARTTEIDHLRNLLANIINSMPSVLIGVDRDSRVIQWNQQAEQLTGIKSAAAEGRHLQDLIPEYAQELKRLDETIRTRIPFSHHKRICRAANSVRYEDVTIYPLVANGVDGAVIRIDDVTDKTRLEEMMIQSEKMVSVGGLAAGMAHEINNPLAGIIQNTVVVKNRLTTDIEANRKAADRAGTSLEAVHGFVAERNIDEMLHNVIESGKRASRIVQNMLSFARKSSFQKSEVDLRELLDRTVELARSDYNLKKEYDFRNIRIEKEYQPGVPPVTCEITKVQQVLLNIMRNGAEAMCDREFRENQGRDFKPQLTLRVFGVEDRVQIEIEDNGPGIPADERSHIFEPFYTTKEVGKGTGLGLSVSYFIIKEDHGGTMEVESEEGRGSCFTISLPVSGGDQ